MEYQVITDDNGRIVAVLAYATLRFAQEVARTYARVLGGVTVRHTVRANKAPMVGEKMQGPRPLSAFQCFTARSF